MGVSTGAQRASNSTTMYRSLCINSINPSKVGHATVAKIPATQSKNVARRSRSFTTPRYCTANRRGWQTRLVLASGSGQPTTTEQQISLSLDLPTSEAQTTIRFSSVSVGRGTAIVVAAVAAGSSAEAAGVHPGQQLLALSDPIRADETWKLNERASLRYVRDAVRMRRADYLVLELSVEPLREWEEAVRSVDASMSESGAESSPEDEWRGEADASMAEDEGARVGDGLTVKERLQLEYEREAASGRKSAMQQRMERRKEYFEQATERNDGPFFAGLLALFVLPALAILVAASASGYLDDLAAGWR